MNPQRSPSDSKLVAFTCSPKPPNKFPFQPPVSATSSVSNSRLHGKYKGDNILGIKDIKHQQMLVTG